ncbi:hypothetical protein [Archangium primigenium]|uniref:hypothetical protein n=1 Tax=[Archangium] primigenium TaxID=2792470 RepID=UPI00195702F8|nr:hypothetical protein [Archangium primigenium]MBM7116969.1 hypothetical protein [Archangium primigenium]
MRSVTAMMLGGTAGLLMGCSEQPSPGCQVQDGPWHVVYLLKNPAQAGSSCGGLTSDTFGVYKFLVPASEDPRTPSSMALRPQAAVSLATYVDAAGVRQPRVDLTPPADPTSPTDPTGALQASRGATALSTSFPNEPDAQDVCRVPSFSRISLAARAVTDGSGAALPAQTVDYQFSDVYLYSSPSAPGVLFRGALVFGDGACTAEYQVLGLSPAVPCTTDAQCRDPATGINPEVDAVCLQGGCAPNPQTLTLFDE